MSLSRRRDLDVLGRMMREALARNPEGLPFADLRARLRVRRQTLLRVISRLRAQGLVRRDLRPVVSGDGRHRRVAVYTLAKNAHGDRSRGPDGGSRSPSTIPSAGRLYGPVHSPAPPVPAGVHEAELLGLVPLAEVAPPVLVAIWRVVDESSPGPVILQVVLDERDAHGRIGGRTRLGRLVNAIVRCEDSKGMHLRFSVGGKFRLTVAVADGVPVVRKVEPAEMHHEIVTEIAKEDIGEIRHLEVRSITPYRPGSGRRGRRRR